ncbi:MAG: hypothetical protein LKF82_10795 [Acinetobacter populi]|uniref:factor H binding protein domain-containing protein n=1 Tax=Acinetobacter populi TaxID=1582270 RepID=UPI002354AD77|nr:factor H binding protein domain-containing protein [Acinetobacter populi]MCH4248297.1 hypothetical protein [Acinetobacter populi]
MLSKSILKVGILAASVLVTSIASADVSFSENASNYNFTTADGYLGTFTFDGGSTVYGVGATNFDFTASTVPLGYTREASTQTVDGASRTVVYKFYKQANSVVIGNIANGSGTSREFVKGVVGTPTVYSSLPNTNATYNYKGVVFNHIDGTEGTLDYNVNVSGNTITGSGSIAGVTGNRPSVVGGAFTLAGDLEQVTFTTDSNGKFNPVTGGTANLTLTNSLGDFELEDVKYDIGVYGAGAAEVAGGIYGGDLESSAVAVSGYGIAGELKSVTPNP